MRKFYKTTYTFTVLSEDQPPSSNMDLKDIIYECEDGGWSGAISSYSSVELSGPEMAIELSNQGSSPEFFDLDDDGTDIS